MNRPRPLLPVAILLVCLWFVLAAGTVHAQLSAPYEPPDLTTPIFDLGRVGVDGPTRSRLTSILAAGVTYYNATLDAKILGVALRLDPANRDALTAAEHRKRNELPDAKANPAAYPTATVVNYLVGQCVGLRAKGGADNGALAGCLSEIAAELAPDHPGAKYEKSACARLGFAPTWAFLPHRPAPGSEALPLLKRMATVRGLSVSDLPHGGRVGNVLEIIVTAWDAHSRQEIGVTTARPVGVSMRAALDEAWRAVCMRHPGTGMGQKLVLSFGDIQSAKDGPSAGAAFTLALYSLYDPVRLATDAAMTGAMTVDGRVRPVGGVPWKIRAALAVGCRVVAIPKENASAVDDLPFLYPANTAWKIQIVAVDTLDEALAVMRVDRPANVQAALDLFATIQRRVGEAEHLGATHADLAPALQEVLRLCPGHASAASMLKTVQGRAVGTLSLYTSLDELERLTDAIFNELHGMGPPTKTTAAQLQTASANLDSLRPRLDYRTVDLCNARANVLHAAAAYYGMQQVSQADVLRQEVLRCAQAADEVERRMSSDPALAEALRH